MSSGRHRRPEPDPLPDVDLAERLGPGPVIRAESEPVGPVAAAPARHHAAPASDVPASEAPASDVPAPEAASPSPPAASAAGTAAAAPGATVVVRRDRRAERTARRKARRQRLLVVAGGILGVVLVAVGLWLLLRPSEEQAPTSTRSGDEQLITLVQVTGADGTAAASAIVGTTKGDGAAVALLVPSRLNVDVAGSGAMAFGETTTIGDPEASSASLTDLLGLRVNDTWTLTKPALAALVDAVGGVQAAVDVDVVATAPNGDQTVVVKAGNQLLKGEAAANYATYLADGEPEEARLARFDDVLTALVAKLPDDATGIGAFLGTAGAGSTSDLDQGALAARLAVMRSAAAGGEFASDVLPVNAIDTGGSVPSYGLNAGDAEAALRDKFPGALQKDAAGGVVRVLVENGVGTPGLVEQARTKLVDAGFQFKNGGNASPFSNQPSSIQVADGTDASLAKGRRVAAALGLPADSVVPNDRGQTIADVIVILGPDFAP